MQRLSSIRSLLIGLQLAIALPLIGLLIFAVYWNYQADSQKAGASALNLAQANGANVEQLILNAKTDLSYFAGRPLVRALNPSQCDPLLAEFGGLNPQYTNVALYGADGQNICSAIPLPPESHPNARDLGWFQTVARTNGFVTGAPAVGQMSSKWGVPLVYPVLDASGQFAGAVNMPLDLEKLQSIWTDMALPAGSEIAIIDNNGVVITHSIDPEKWYGKNECGTEVVDIVLANGEGTAQVAGTDGVNRLYGFTTIPSVGWHIVVGMPSAIELAAARQTFIYGIGLILGFILLTGILGWLITRGIEQPLTRLGEAAKAIGEGNLARTAPVQSSSRRFARMISSPASGVTSSPHSYPIPASQSRIKSSRTSKRRSPNSIAVTRTRSFQCLSAHPLRRKNLVE